METENRLNYLRQRSSNLIVMKECQYKKKENSDNINFKFPLRIRDALYGGQTSVLYKDCFHMGKIFHVDFNSLYPSVQYEESYPI